MRVIILIVLGLSILSCKNVQYDQALYKDFELVDKWVDMTLYITQYTPANSPTYASRCLGYIGLTMYESVVHGAEQYNSLEGQLNGLNGLPNIESNQDYYWPASLNAGQAAIIKYLYNQTADTNKVKIDSLAAAVLVNFKHHGIDQERLDRSIAFGEAVAKIIFEWSKTDGGHRAYLKNFDKDWQHPNRPGSWKPPLFAQSFSHHPLHPSWGSNRTFVKSNELIENPKFLTYSTDTASAYYKEFYEVYAKDLDLTQEEKEIALWWGDDPDESFTPPGHSYYIANLVVQGHELDIVKSAEVFARTGMAVADAFINCWKWKYHFFSERPNTFIPKHIEQAWESFWPDPPFPSFPSGHAIQAAAAATVFIDLYGEEFSFIDSSHVYRERDEVRDVDFRPRSFTKFWDVALETADSRFYGGIHIPSDNRVGLEEGQRIAGHVNKLKWRK